MAFYIYHLFYDNVYDELLIAILYLVSIKERQYYIGYEKEFQCLDIL